MKPKLNSNVSVVKISDEILEFFQTNTRRQLHIKVENDLILDIVTSLDGTKDIEEIAREYGVQNDTLESLLKFLLNKGILDTVDSKLDFNGYERYRRVIHFLSDYASSHEDLVNMWKNINKSTVMIIGLGAVGSWVACNLAQSGVKQFILMDPDVVELTNIHRQFAFCESDIGMNKVDVMEQRLKEYDDNISVQKIVSFLDETVLDTIDASPIDLIINCADKPNVDTTSLWIGEYSMKKNIPHIIGGGYNLHLSLIGQTVIPGETACVNCFKRKLEEENKIDKNVVKKLMIENRKVGSFAPMCSMISSMIGMEAIKILSKKIPPANINRRGEFDIYTMDIVYKQYERDPYCEWCGENGKYNNKKCL